MKTPPPAPPKDETKSLPKPTPAAKVQSSGGGWFGGGSSKRAVTESPANGFRSKRIGNDNTSTTAKSHDSMGIDWSGVASGDVMPTGGSHAHADVLGYSGEDYLHSRLQLVQLIERGLKPPQTLFVQLEACAYKMSEVDLREEYKWYVATYLSEASSVQLKGACEMLVIKLGEIVSMPLAARLAKKATDSRLMGASVTPRQAVVVETNLGPGGSKDYEAYTKLRSQALESRRKLHRVQEETYAEIDLRMYTLPTADMVTEYKYLAQIYLDYEFSLEKGEQAVRGFCELRLMRLGELLYMPLQLRIAAIRADAILSKTEKKMPGVVSASLERPAETESLARLDALSLGTPPPKPPPKVKAGEAPPPPTQEQIAEMATELMPTGKPDTTPRDTFLTSAPPMTPSEAAMAGAKQLPAAPTAVAVPSSAVAATPAGFVPAPVQADKRPQGAFVTPVKKPDKPYQHGQSMPVNVDMLRDIATLGGQPPDAAYGVGPPRAAPNKAAWGAGAVADGASSLMAAETTQRSGVPKWLQKLRMRENLGGRRRDADQLRLLDLAAEAASQGPSTACSRTPRGRLARAA